MGRKTPTESSARHNETTAIKPRATSSPLNRSPEKTSCAWPHLPHGQGPEMPSRFTPAPHARPPSTPADEKMSLENAGGIPCERVHHGLPWDARSTMREGLAVRNSRHVCVQRLAVTLGIWIDPRLTIGTETLVAIGDWEFGRGALESGFATSIRLMAIVALSLIGGLTTSGTDFVRAMRRAQRSKHLATRAGPLEAARLARGVRVAATRTRRRSRRCRRRRRRRQPPPRHRRRRGGGAARVRHRRR